MNGAPNSVVNGFDYFGSGNIGDDLMMAGFFGGAEKLGLAPRDGYFGFTSWDIEAMRRRFPQMSWRMRSDRETAQREWPRDCWAGVGGTPFQYAVGDWILKYWQNELEYISQFKRRVLVNVGAETEIQPRISDFAAVSRDFDAISTRDEHSYRIVTEMLKFPREKAFLASDLANITLRELFPTASQKTEKVGFILTGDTLTPKDVRALRRFVVGSDKPVRFLANVTNDKIDSEILLHRRMSRSLWPWDKFSRVCKLWIPDYERGSLQDLVAGVASCETIFSSRYHGILIAAWAGCRVAAIGRSSKVTALARELGIACCTPPLTETALRETFDRAQTIPRSRLEAMADRALAGIDFVLGGTGTAHTTPPISSSMLT